MRRADNPVGPPTPVDSSCNRVSVHAWDPQGRYCRGSSKLLILQKGDAAVIGYCQVEWEKKMEESGVRGGGLEKKSGAVTMNDVAAVAGVSLKTVSNVVNEYPHVSLKTRERVLKAIDKLGYQVNLTAQSLRRGKTGLVGLAVPDLSAPYFGELAQVLTVEADRHNLSVLVELTGGTREGEEAVLSGPRRGLTDGVLFSPIETSADDLNRAVSDYPLVLLGETVFGTAADHVTMSNIEASQEAVRYLISRGARKIALLGAEERGLTTAGSLRTEGYFLALEEAGMAVDPGLLLAAPHWDRSSGATAMTEALDRGVAFDAVFGVVDVLAIGALHALHLHSKQIPQDVQVVGFDNIDESAYVSPPLTTIDPGMRQIARDAVALLAAQINGSGRKESRLVYAPYSLIKRGSTL